MRDMLELQTIKGKLVDLDVDPKQILLQVHLSENMVFYKEASQIVGDEREIQVDAFGYWEIDLLDTDHMTPEAYYIFNINNRLYRKLIPVNAQDWDFHELPNLVIEG